MNVYSTDDKSIR